ncbi:hypothetical protein [Candidatus Tisiphia endosymbiont of Nemotelus uliginosus]|uniref:hypothetical protein n=1 Tax=Candidatus Tisiphia endosymbiont of Nemotelus uliginosus TaxID=3077926 RepID=UPI0035C93948
MAEADNNTTLKIKKELTELKAAFNSPTSRSKLITMLARVASVILEASRLGLDLQISELLQAVETQVKNYENKPRIEIYNTAQDKAAAEEEKLLLKEAAEIVKLSREFTEAITTERNLLRDISTRIAKGEDISQKELDQFCNHRKIRQAKQQAWHYCYQKVQIREQVFVVQTTTLKNVIDDPNVAAYKKEAANQELVNIEKQHGRFVPLLKVVSKAQNSFDDIQHDVVQNSHVLTQSINNLPKSDPRKTKLVQFAQLIAEESNAEISNKTLPISTDQAKSFSQAELRQLGNNIKTNLLRSNGHHNITLSALRYKVGGESKGNKGIK